jgi:hypothetical protein
MKENNLPAFPFSYHEFVSDKTNNGGGEVKEFHYQGMTLRDYFAGQALSNMELGFSTSQYKPEGEEGYQKSLSFRIRIIADYSYRLADAMLKARGERE